MWTRIFNTPPRIIRERLKEMDKKNKKGEDKKKNE